MLVKQSKNFYIASFPRDLVKMSDHGHSSGDAAHGGEHKAENHAPPKAEHKAEPHASGHNEKNSGKPTSIDGMLVGAATIIAGVALGAAFLYENAPNNSYSRPSYSSHSEYRQ